MHVTVLVFFRGPGCIINIFLALLCRCACSPSNSGPGEVQDEVDQAVEARMAGEDALGSSVDAIQEDVAADCKHAACDSECSCCTPADCVLEEEEDDGEGGSTLIQAARRRTLTPFLRHVLEGT